MLLKLLDIIIQSIQKSLSMLRRKYNSRFNLSLGHTRNNTNKVNYKLSRRMRNNCKIRVCTLCNFITQFDLNLSLFFYIFHYKLLLKVAESLNWFKQRKLN